MYKGFFAEYLVSAVWVLYKQNLNLCSVSIFVSGQSLLHFGLFHEWGA